MKIVKIIFSFLISLNSLTFIGQCTNQVIHTEGTETINNIEVTVTSSGKIDINNDFCDETFPYIIGFNVASGGNNGDGDGMYIFDFSPPINYLTLNIGGVSNLFDNSESVVIGINGNHYPIPNIGNENSCGSLAILTSEGNIEGCINCNVSGWNDLSIEGPISQLIVENKLLSGYPAGSIFSLFICDQYLGIDENEIISNFTLYPNPTNKNFTMELNETYGKVEIELLNIIGQSIGKYVKTNSKKIELEINDQPGIYFCNVKLDGKNEGTMKIIKN